MQNEVLLLLENIEQWNKKLVNNLEAGNTSIQELIEGVIF